MTSDELNRYRLEFAKRAEGYRLLELERQEKIRSIDTQESILTLKSAFRSAMRLPLRQTSGLQQYYAILMKAKNAGSL